MPLLENLKAPLSIQMTHVCGFFVQEADPRISGAGLEC